MTPAILSEGLVKRYGDTLALAGLDLRVPAGTVHGLLGHDGAGKTTAMRILCALERPDAGRATVAGRDVLADPDGVRDRVAVAGQHGAFDPLQSGVENLVLLGRRHGLRRRDALARAHELLVRFGLDDDDAGRAAGDYSGGMRRLLDLAASLVVRRPIVFLDEPTTGLDPRSRAGVWNAVRRLADDGTTVLLTTRYLDEAARLADEVTVLAAGRVVAEGTPAELRDRVGARRVEAVVTRPQMAAAAERVLAALGLDTELDARARRISIAAEDGGDDLATHFA